MRLEALVQASAAVAASPGRLAKIATLAAFLEQLSPDEIEIAIGFFTGWPRQGKIGVGWATVADARAQAPARDATLELRDVDQLLAALQGVKGKGSAGERLRLLNDLFARATAAEQQFLAALAIGEVRQGALEGVMLEAVAKAARVPAASLRRAVMIAGDLGTVARALRSEGDSALAGYRLELFRPIQPMLADSASNIAEALERTADIKADIKADMTAAVEWKLDGARIQVHRDGDRVAVYTRNLNEVTSRVPEVVEAVRDFPARQLIFDGEVIALEPDGRPRSFQDTMRRFGKKLEAEALRAELPLSPYFFDVLLHDSDELLDRPLSERLERLDAIVPSQFRVPRIVTSDVDEGERFRADALARGHEGVIVKALAAPYAAGRRGAAWVKVKTARTLDLVVLAAEWGSGRRQGWLSNLHLGARDPATGGYIMLGKTFKGMTDEILEWQTKELLAREERRDGHIVYVRPELVVEIAFNEVQRSSQYPGGVTLRFARVKGYRPDKSAAESDTIDAVRAYA